jgi:hypothetical protein
MERWAKGDGPRSLHVGGLRQSQTVHILTSNCLAIFGPSPSQPRRAAPAACVGFCRSLTEVRIPKTAREDGVKSTKFATYGSGYAGAINREKEKFYRKLSHTIRNYGLEISYGSHSKLWDTPTRAPQLARVEHGVESVGGLLGWF